MTDCLKALHGVVQEYEYFTGSESRSKMVSQVLRRGPGHRLSIRLNATIKHFFDLFCSFFFSFKKDLFKDDHPERYRRWSQTL